jgi:cobalt-precorrin-5B (C1)-methyltransferase
MRKGWTTGACATASAKAAFQALLSGAFPDPVTITLPRGLHPAFALSRQERDAHSVTAGVVKDAGDDPDVTHGAEIIASVALLPPGSGIVFKAGSGVGTVTLPGLPLAVGEPAINPKPREMIAANLAAVAATFGAPLDLAVTIAIPGGAEIAAGTWNPRLGIVGGLSILGTTGVVVPYSCAAWIHSIHRGIDVARAIGLDHLGAATGRGSELAVMRETGLSEQAMIDMGDFAGGLLKYLRDHPVARLTLGGGFGKLAKLAAGALDLHSKASQVDAAILARWLEELGAAPGVVAQAQTSHSAAAILALAGDLPLADLVARRARETAMAVVAGRVAIEIMVFDREGRRLAHAA